MNDQSRVRRRSAADPVESAAPGRGAGGETPPRRGSAVARLLAGGGHGDSFTEDSFRGEGRRRAPEDDFPVARTRDHGAASRSESAATRPRAATKPADGTAAKRPRKAAPESPDRAAAAKQPRRGAPKPSRGEASAMRPRGEAGAKSTREGAAKSTREGSAKPAKPSPPTDLVGRSSDGAVSSSSVVATRPVRAAADASTAPAAHPGVARSVRGWSGEASGKPRREVAGKPTKPRRESGGERLAPGRERLQKVLAAAGIAARRKAEDLIAAGRVTVNGRVANELGVKVDPERDQIRVDGKFVQVEKKVYFLLNKPDGVVCSAEGTQDAEGRPTVLSLLATVTQRVYPVGRLDYHTRGVLILTNDGDLAAKLTHPRHEITKTYHVTFQGRLGAAELAALGQGIALDDGVVTRPAEEVSGIKETDTNTWVQITLRQGLNRQVRRMGDAIGHPVLKLIRVAIGTVTADGLADGEFRPLTPTEVYDLMAAASR